MACIVDKLSKALNRKVTSDQIWAHLKTMYNLKALNDLELLIPFPNEQQDFALPEIEFSSYNLKRLPETEIPPVEPSVAVKSGKDSKDVYFFIYLFIYLISTFSCTDIFRKNTESRSPKAQRTRKEASKSGIRSKI